MFIVNLVAFIVLLLILLEKYKYVVAVLCLVITISNFLAIHYLLPVNTEYRKILKDEFEKYTPDSFSWLDDLQESFYCCSIQSFETQDSYIPFRHWNSNFNSTEVPKSCCRAKNEIIPAWLNPNEKGRYILHNTETLHNTEHNTEKNRWIVFNTEIVRYDCNQNSKPEKRYIDGCDKNLKKFVDYKKGYIPAIKWISSAVIFLASLSIWCILLLPFSIGN
jgi:hypothetical protein